MRNYSIMPLNIDHVDEICKDIRRQHEEGIASCVLFKMSLVPEGIPAIDKASLLCGKYDMFRDKLASYGIECGILVQSTIGHGYKLAEEPQFQHYISYRGGEQESVCCPYDENFRNHMYIQFATLAKHNPAMIMVDDDFRLMHRAGVGCTCPLHMKRISEIYGKELTRQDFIKHMENGDEDLFGIFYETQRESLLGAVKAMRDGIDSVNSSIPGSFCMCGIEFGGEIASILAGKGNPVVVRVNNARYASMGAREFSPIMFRAATQIEMVKDRADYILAETDTCPQNRYSTSASNLHSHFTASILEGCNGAKQWITRMIDYEPESGEAYRQILSRYSMFYETLANVQPKLKWLGCRIPIPSKPQICIDWDKKSVNGWHNNVLERMGIPFYFANKNGGAVFLDGDDDEFYNDEEILDILKGEVYCSVEAAKNLIERGFGEYIGVDIKPWAGAAVSGELLHTNGKVCAAQKGLKELIPLNEKVESVSEIFHLKRSEIKEFLFPGVTVFENKLGGSVTVFCGTPKTPYTYYEAFSFLNESRKKQIVSLLKRGKNLPMYYVGDAEICLRAAKVEGTNMFFCVIYNIGFDSLKEIKIWTTADIENVSVLCHDGIFRDVNFKIDRGNIVIDTEANTLLPVVFILTPVNRKL